MAPSLLVETWDDPRFGATWDSGLDWDSNVGPTIGDVAPYLALITSAHNRKSNYMAMLRLVFEPLGAIQRLIAGMPALFDIDFAVGEQEDFVGQWVGATRNVSVALPNVYFSLDSAPLGLDFGSMQGGDDPTTGLIILPDEQYRTLLRARVANNQWDGTIPGAYAIWNTLFAGTGTGILIQDLGNMHMIFALTGPTPDAVTLALFTGGYLDIRPAGVRIDYYITPPTPAAPYFGLDAETSGVSGLDVGAFGVETAGS